MRRLWSVLCGAHISSQRFLYSPSTLVGKTGFAKPPKRIDVSPLDCESDQGRLPGCKAAKG